MADQTYFRKGFGLKDAIQGALAEDYHSAIVDEVKGRGYELAAEGVTVRLAREFGFCYGVDRAVEYAYETRRKFPERRIFLVGEIIHNPHVNAKLATMGIVIIERSAAGEFDFSGVTKDDVVILPAFGVTKADFDRLRDLGCVLVDTTCGSVLNVWKRVESYSKDGFTALIHGKYFHEETKATASQVTKHDGGKYLVTARAPGYRPWTTTIEVSAESLDAYLAPVWRGKQSLVNIKRRGINGKLPALRAVRVEKIAEGFEGSKAVIGMAEGQEVHWQERRLIVHSLGHAKAAEAGLASRLQKAQSALEALTQRKQGKERFTDADTLRQAAETMLQQQDLQGLLQVQIGEEVQKRQVRQYGGHPAETRREHRLTLTVQRSERAIQKTIRRFGWRVYGTNHPQSQLSLPQAVLAYREEYIVEHCFGRLKGKPLSLTPMYLEDDRHATGLTRLLSIGIRILTLLEHRARSHLAEQGEKLSGLYAGNPTRATDRPTTEALLRAFENIYLNFVTVGGQTYHHLTPLSKLQREILRLLELPASIYTRLDTESPAHFPDSENSP